MLDLCAIFWSEIVLLYLPWKLFHFRPRTLFISMAAVWFFTILARRYSCMHFFSASVVQHTLISKPRPFPFASLAVARSGTIRLRNTLVGSSCLSSEIDPCYRALPLLQGEETAGWQDSGFQQSTQIVAKCDGNYVSWWQRVTKISKLGSASRAFHFNC